MGHKYENTPNHCLTLTTMDMTSGTHRFLRDVARLHRWRRWKRWRTSLDQCRSQSCAATLLRCLRSAPRVCNMHRRHYTYDQLHTTLTVNVFETVGYSSNTVLWLSQHAYQRKTSKGDKLSCHYLSNAFAKNYENQVMFARVTTKNCRYAWDTVYMLNLISS